MDRSADIKDLHVKHQGTVKYGWGIFVRIVDVEFIVAILLDNYEMKNENSFNEINSKYLKAIFIN